MSEAGSPTNFDSSPLNKQQSLKRSATSRQSQVSEQKLLTRLFDKNINIVFVPNGTNLQEKKAPSVKIDVAPYFNKYDSKKYHITPEGQAALHERAYLEMLEDCSALFNKKKKIDQEQTFFSMIYTSNGSQIKTMADLKRYIYTRVSQENASQLQGVYGSKTQSPSGSPKRGSESKKIGKAKFVNRDLSPSKFSSYLSNEQSPRIENLTVPTMLLILGKEDEIF